MELISELTSIDHILDQAAMITGAMRIAMSETISSHERGDASGRSDTAHSKALFTATVQMPDDT
jgi:hypothetical protein